MILTSTYLFTLVLAIIMTLLTWVIDSQKIKAQFANAKNIRDAFALVLLGLIIWLAYQNFMPTLTLIGAATGIIALIDQILFKAKRECSGSSLPLITEYARSFFSVLLIVWVIRSFIIQPYRVPTGSLEPTVMPGDFLAVSQFSYGLKFPIGNYKLFNIGEPKVGDITLFYYPLNPQVVFVKRVIGTPGDHIVYKNKILYINGKEATQTDVGAAMDIDPAMGNMPEEQFPVQKKIENLNGIKHFIYVRKNGGEAGDFDIIVPSGMYFMMGDNRDDSDDSRMWGFVPERNLIGKAFFIWMNWDPIQHKIIFNRLGKIGKGVPNA